MSLKRLARSTLEIVLYVAPIAAALAGIVLSLVFWPGGIVGGGALLLIAWWCHKRTERMGREHRW